MAYTQAQIDALKAAIASGAKTVSYNGELVTYQDTASMIAALAMMEGDGPSGPSTGGRSTVAEFDRR